MSHDLAMDLAGRMWDAAYALDTLRGDRDASEWIARKIHELMRIGGAEDVALLARLAAVVESRLARERGEAA